MQVNSHIDGSDILLSSEDLKMLSFGKALTTGRLTVKLANKDIVCKYNATRNGVHLTMHNANLELTFDGVSGKLKGVEIV